MKLNIFGIGRDMDSKRALVVHARDDLKAETFYSVRERGWYTLIFIGSEEARIDEFKKYFSGGYDAEELGLTDAVAFNACLTKMIVFSTDKRGITTAESYKLKEHYPSYVAIAKVLGVDVSISTCRTVGGDSVLDIYLHDNYFTHTRSVVLHSSDSWGHTWDYATLPEIDGRFRKSRQTLEERYNNALIKLKENGYECNESVG